MPLIRGDTIVVQQIITSSRHLTNNNVIYATYPNLNGWSECNAQPVSVWREAQCINDVIVIQSM